MNEAIKLAIEKGGYKGFNTWHNNPNFDYFYESSGLCGTRLGYHEDSKIDVEVTTDPLFWQALGKALGNKDEMRCDSSKCNSKLCQYAGYKDPKRMFDSYMECIWYGHDTEACWKKLLKSNDNEPNTKKKSA